MINLHYNNVAHTPGHIGCGAPEFDLPKSFNNNNNNDNDNNNNNNIPLFTLGSVYSTVLVGPSKQLKQIFQIEHNIVKNPNCLEANQLAIYKRSQGFELGATEKQIQEEVRAGLEPRTAGLRVRHANLSATLPPSFERGLHI